MSFRDSGVEQNNGRSVLRRVGYIGHLELRLLQLKHLRNDRPLWWPEMENLGKLSRQIAQGGLRKLQKVDVVLSCSKGLQVASYSRLRHQAVTIKEFLKREPPPLA